MTTPMIDAVLAGTRGFALALLAPLTERIGTRPRIAADPLQALALCSGPGGLVVVEFLGADTLRAIQDLVLEGSGVRIVAALPEAHAAAEGPLRALGVDVARWNGAPEGVVGAVARQLAAAAAAPTRTAPPSPRAHPPSSAGAPPPAPFARVGASTPVRASPAPASAPPAPAAAPRVAPPTPAPPLGRPAPVTGASGPPRAGATSARAAAPSDPMAGVFDDLADPDLAVDVDMGDGLAAPSAAGGGRWPTNVPGEAEAANALARALAGSVPRPDSPLAGAVASLSTLEQAVLSGEPAPLEPEPLRRAAAMRVRVAAALASVPADPAEVDAAAVSALLAEIDALLAEVGALVARASPEAQPSLEAVRNALVKEAIDFSEAAQRASFAGDVAPATLARPPAAASTRVLSVSKAPDEPRVDGRHRILYALLAATALLAGAYHGQRWWVPRAAPELPRLAGAPSNAVASRTSGGPLVVHSPDGAPFAAEEQQRFADQESLKGNSVVEIAPGALLVVPGEPPSPNTSR